MITIKNTDFTSNVSLAAMLMVRTKENMLDTCKKLDLHVSLNLKKERHGVSHKRFSTIPFPCCAASAKANCN